jgi:hypothetical protein
MMQVGIRTTNGQAQISIDKAPSDCPVCHVSIVAGDLAVGFQYGDRAERVYQCPNTNCQVLFIAQYERQGPQQNQYSWRRSVPFEFEPTPHTETIKTISPDFCEIYGQAEKAEQHGLTLVAGPGYRKALEFLMKDYALLSHPAEKTSIEQMPLASCIATFIGSEQIKQIARRAAWLGNDETHYVRRWTDKDLDDLKKLISLTLHWIEAEKLSQDIIKDMPESGPASTPPAPAPAA